MTKRKRRIKVNKQLMLELFSVGIFFGLIALGACTAQDAFMRFFEAVRDLGLSLGYFVNDAVVPSVTCFSNTTAAEFPKIKDDVITTAKSFGKQFISLDNLIAYGARISVAARWLLVALIIVFTVTVILLITVFTQIHSKNTDYSANSRPLRAWLKVYISFYLPVKRFFIRWKQFLKEHKGYKYAILCVILFYLNVFTVGLEIISYYFYFVFSYDIIGLLTQLLKLLWDIDLAFRFLPLWLWIPVGIWAFDKLRRARAYHKLDKQEDRMRNFIKDRAIVFMICAPMREGKTTLLTSMMMSIEKMIRSDADDELFKIKKRFPHFPWQRLQHFIAKGMKRHRLYNLQSCRAIVDFMEQMHKTDKGTYRVAMRWMRRKFGMTPSEFPDELFGYDTKNFPVTYDDGAKVEDIFRAMRDFAQLYFAYRCPTSLITANYNIRLDNDFEDEGNYPHWKDDFFDPEPSKGSLNAHVLNQDMLRLGRRKDPKNPFNDALEFGGIAQTEIGKERGNQYDLRGLSAQDEDCNQVNDYYNANLKMWGHGCTVRYIPLSRFGCDEQRPENWGADAKNVCDIITICDKSKDKILLPFFAIEEAAYLFSTWLVKKLFKKYDFNRGDNTLTMWIVLMLYSIIFNHYTRIENTFGGYYDSVFWETGMRVNDGSQACKTGTEKLFISRKKVYSDRFDTAAWRTFYATKARGSNYGINDIETYTALEVSKENMKTAHSHFFDKVMKLFEGGAAFPPLDEKANKHKK